MKKQRSAHLAVLTCSAVLIAACGGGSDASDVDVSSSEAIDEERDEEERDDEPTETSSDPGDSGEDSPPDTTPADAPVATDVLGSYTDPESPCAVKVAAGEYDTIDCAEPHDAEFAGYVLLDGVRSDDEGEETIRVARACAGPVEELVQRPVAQFGVDVGALAFDDGVAQCWAETTAESVLVGLIAEIGIDAALGDLKMLPDLVPGSCYVEVDDDSYDIVREVSCDEPTAQQLFAFVTLDDRDYPGEDAVVSEAFEKCDFALTATTTQLISQGYSIVFPEDPGWTAMEQRTVSCAAVRDDTEVAELDIEPGDDSGDSDAASSGFWDIPDAYEWGVDAPICLLVVDDGEVNDNTAEWNQVDCDQPHSDEVLAVVDPPFTVLPDDAAVAIEALRDLCNPFLENQTGQLRELPGLNIGFSVTASLGTLIESPVACMATVNEDPFLVGSLTTLTIQEVLGDVVVLANLDPGTCFTFPGESFSLGVVAQCSEPGAVMAVGTYILDEVVGELSIDNQRAERFGKCLPIYEASGLAGDVGTLSGTFPSDSSYLYDGERIGTCDIAPV